MCSFPNFALACLWWQHQQRLQRRWFEWWQPPEAAGTPRAVGGWWSGLRELLALPFDIARHLHAAGVQAGALPRSVLESQRFEQRLGLMERLALGPLARTL